MSTTTTSRPSSTKVKKGEDTHSLKGSDVFRKIKIKRDYSKKPFSFTDEWRAKEIKYAIRDGVLATRTLMYVVRQFEYSFSIDDPFRAEGVRGRTVHQVIDEMMPHLSDKEARIICEHLTYRIFDKGQSITTAALERFHDLRKQRNLV